jgi:hypothetical protein
MLSDHVAPSKILKEGWLEKQSRHLKRWRKRWFVLQDCTLYSYAQEKVYDTPTEMIDLRVFCSVKSCEDVTLKEHSFVVYSSAAAFTMVAATEPDKEDWIRAIGRAIVISRTKTWHDEDQEHDPNEAAPASSSSSSSSSSSTSSTTASKPAPSTSAK